MFELHLFIPVEDNAKVAFTSGEFAAFEAAILGRFGGFTIYTGVAAGAWVDANGRRYDDSHRVYGILVRSIVDGGLVGALAEDAKRIFRQEAVMIRFLGVGEIL